MSFFSSFEHHEHLHKEFFVRRLSENPAKVEISRPGTVVVGWLHGFQKYSLRLGTILSIHEIPNPMSVRETNEIFD